MSAPSLALVGAALVAGLVLMGRVRTLASTPSADGGAAALTVVIPARDEANRLPRLLASLGAQTRRATRLVVVDDGSSDDTATVARAGGAEVVTTDGPADGWAGKVWACHLGTLDLAPSDVVVLLDADVWLAPDGLSCLAAAHAAAVPDGLLSVQPYHATERAYEQLSAVANVVPVMASGLAALRPPASSTVAFGPCLVTTGEALAAVGGFAAVRASTIEDVALAGRYRQAGRPVRCLAGGATVQFRMYDQGWRSLVEGWTKNLAGGARHTPWWSTIGAVVWVAGALAAGAAVVVEPSPWSALAWVAMAAQTWWMLRRLGRFRWWAWAVFPIPTVAFVVFFVRSVFARRVRHTVDWRGRRVAVRP